MFSSFTQADKALSQELYQIAQSLPWVSDVIKVLAVYVIYLIPLALIYFWLRHTHRISGFLGAIAGMISWFGINGVIGKLLFRERPFSQPSLDIQELVFHRPDKSFPSDHASVAFAISLVFAYHKQYRPALLFLSIGLITSLARVAAGLHFFGDILGAVPSALLAVGIVLLLRRPLTKRLLPRCEQLLRSVKLA